MNTIGQSIVENNLTILEMKAEIDRLKQENQELRERNDLLVHNIIDNQNDKKEFLNNDEQSNEYIDFLNNDAIMYCYNAEYQLNSLE
jgi:transposase-like protein